MMTNDSRTTTSLIALLNETKQRSNKRTTNRRRGRHHRKLFFEEFLNIIDVVVSRDDLSILTAIMRAFFEELTIHLNLYKIKQNIIK